MDEDGDYELLYNNTDYNRNNYNSYNNKYTLIKKILYLIILFSIIFILRHISCLSYDSENISLFKYIHECHLYLIDNPFIKDVVIVISSTITDLFIYYISLIEIIYSNWILFFAYVIFYLFREIFNFFMIDNPGNSLYTRPFIGSLTVNYSNNKLYKIPDEIPILFIYLIYSIKNKKSLLKIAFSIILLLFQVLISLLLIRFYIFQILFGIILGWLCIIYCINAKVNIDFMLVFKIWNN